EVIGAGIHVLDVAARAEHVACARQDHAADAHVRLGFGAGGNQRARQLGAQRVARRGSVDRQEQDRPLPLGLEDGAAHAKALSSAVSGLPIWSRDSSLRIGPAKVSGSSMIAQTCSPTSVSITQCGSAISRLRSPLIMLISMSSRICAPSRYSLAKPRYIIRCAA